MIVPPRSSVVSTAGLCVAISPAGTSSSNTSLADGENEPEVAEQLRRLLVGEAAQLGHAPRLRPVGDDQFDLGAGEHVAAERDALDARRDDGAGRHVLAELGGRLGGDELEALDLGSGVGQRQPAEIGNAAELRTFGDDEEQRRPFGEVLARRRGRAG